MFDEDDLDFLDCNLTEVIKFLQRMARDPNTSKLNMAFTEHITNALIKAREEKLRLETSIPRKLEDGWHPTIKAKINDFTFHPLCDLGVSVPVMPKRLYDMLHFKPLDNCSLGVRLVDSTTKKLVVRIDDVLIAFNENYVPVDLNVMDIEMFKLELFDFPLRGRVKKWFRSLPSDNKDSWIKFKAIFMIE